MVVLAYVVAVLGMVGNNVRRALPSPLPVMRLLRSRKVAAAAVCATVVAAHVETFSLPPTFREITLKGEICEDSFWLFGALHAWQILPLVTHFETHQPMGFMVFSSVVNVSRCLCSTSACFPASAFRDQRFGSDYSMYCCTKKKSECACAVERLIWRAGFMSPTLAPTCIPTLPS